MSDAVVTALHLHPVKGCHRVEVDTATATASGLAGDRLWQVVDAEGTCVTQRTHPVMATLATAIDGDGVVTVGDAERGTVTLDRRGAPPAQVASSLLGVEVRAVDGGEDAAEWISDILGGPHRFVALSDEGYRVPSKIDQFDQPVSFADLAPVLVANELSARWLSERADEPFGIDRFRANIVVTATEPWVEDTWAGLTIGEATLSVGLPWPRCAVPQIDQDTGLRQREPARALRAHRWCEETPGLEGALSRIVTGKGLFGVSAGITPVGAVIGVGDPVTVTATREPLLAPPT